MALGTTQAVSRKWLATGMPLYTSLNAALDALAVIETLVNELRTDHATFKTAVDETNTLVTELRTDANALYEAILSPVGLAIGTTNTAVASNFFAYTINGTLYFKAAVAAGTAPGNDVVPQAKYGAVAFDIGADGTIDATEAADNATGYDSAALAVAGLPAVAADHVRMGYVTATKSDGAFTFGTTALDAANTTVAYTSTTPQTLLVISASAPTAGPATLSAAAANLAAVTKLSTVESTDGATAVP